MFNFRAMNKYHAKHCWSELCKREFDSKAEAARGNDLRLLEMAGEITDLEYQKTFVLSEKPKVTITIDFVYTQNGRTVYEDAKGMETREFRVKRIWLKQQQGIDVVLITGGR